MVSSESQSTALCPWIPSCAARDGAKTGQTLFLKNVFSFFFCEALSDNDSTCSLRDDVEHFFGTVCVCVCVFRLGEEDLQGEAESGKTTALDARRHEEALQGQASPRMSMGLGFELALPCEQHRDGGLVCLRGYRLVTVRSAPQGEATSRGTVAL